jgi:phage tail-like protein
MAETARSQSTDPFSMHRFHVTDTGGFLNLATPAAGFNTLIAPEMTIGSVEYQEGTMLYRRKYPGEVTFAPLTLTKGIVKNDSSFYAWMRACAENRIYRTNIIIKHFHRDDVTGLVDYQTAKPWREIHCFNAFVTRVKMGSDFDSMSAEISIEDLDIEIEYFRLFENGVEITAAGA